MYRLKRIGTRTNPWGGPLFSLHFSTCFITYIDYELSVAKHIVEEVVKDFARDNSQELKSKPVLHTVSYAAVRSMKVASILFPFSKPPLMYVVRDKT